MFRHRFRTAAKWALFLVLIKHIIYTNGQIYKDVLTESGLVRGEVNGDIITFLGVPYAAPPIACNRYKAPLPPPHWTGIFQANRKVMCPQDGIGDEDCLIVNIFIPSGFNDYSSFPVIVYIHGGAFLVGSGPTSGVEPLVNQNIAVVTINYRLGALGFLSLGTMDAPGNAGMKDQVAALRWVQRNIANFGGNPEKVTIYGTSAGGVSVELLVLSKVTAGLFQRAIIESGSATSVWAIDNDPLDTAIRGSNMMHFTDLTKSTISNWDLPDLVKLYRDVPPYNLTKISRNFYETLTDGTLGFVPVVEESEEFEPFLKKHPFYLLSDTDYNQVPIMFLYSTLEGLHLRSEEYYNLNYKDKMERNFMEFLPADLVFDTSQVKREIAKAVKSFYFGNKSVVENDITNYLNYFGDYNIMNGLLNSAEKHSANGNPVYVLEFGIKTNLGRSEKHFENVTEAGHADIRRHVILNNQIETMDDKLAVERLSKLIGNFVIHGNPTPNVTELLPIEWPVYEPGKLYLHLGKEFRILTEPQKERKLFWDNLYHAFGMH